MLDPKIWDLLPDGTPRAVFPLSLSTQHLRAAIDATVTA